MIPFDRDIFLSRSPFARAFSVALLFSAPSAAQGTPPGLEATTPDATESPVPVTPVSPAPVNPALSAASPGAAAREPVPSDAVPTATSSGPATQATAVETERTVSSPVGPAVAPGGSPVLVTPLTQPVMEVPKVAPAGSLEESGEEGLWASGEQELRADHDLDASQSRFRSGKGLNFQSVDGQFALIPRLRAQFRYEYFNPDDGDASQAILIRRARLQFKGHMYGHHNRFKVELAFSPHDVGTTDGGPTTSPLLDWYMDFTQYRDLSLRVGQYKVPHNRQRNISSGSLQQVDRSVVNGEFNVDRDLGADVGSKDLFGLDLLKYRLGVFAGQGRNTNTAEDLGVMVLGRIELLPFGMFKDYSEADLARTQVARLSIAVAYAHVGNAPNNRGIKGSTPADGGTSDTHHFVADSIFKYAGFSFQTEFMARVGERNAGDARDDVGDLVPVEGLRDGWGVMGQLGYVLPQTRFEISARAGTNRRFGTESVMTERTEAGGALSYYFAGHPFKLQADYFRLGEKPYTSVASGLEAVAGPLENEHRARVQLQASF